jgi:cytochrome c556
MIRFVLAAAGICLGASIVLAQSADPIAARQELMKANGRASRTGTAIVRGETPFDIAKAREVLQVYVNTAEKFGALFPEDSKTGGKTTAAPKIWEDKAGFDAALAKFGDDARKGLADTKDLESFKTAFAAIGKDCGACHQTYRVRRD